MSAIEKGAGGKADAVRAAVQKLVDSDPHVFRDPHPRSPKWSVYSLDHGRKPDLNGALPLNGEDK